MARGHPGLRICLPFHPHAVGVVLTDPLFRGFVLDQVVFGRAVVRFFVYFTHRLNSVSDLPDLLTDSFLS